MYKCLVNLLFLDEDYIKVDYCVLDFNYKIFGGFFVFCLIFKKGIYL